MISTDQRLKRQRDAGEISGFTLIELLIAIVVRHPGCGRHLRPWRYHRQEPAGSLSGRRGHGVDGVRRVPRTEPDRHAVERTEGDLYKTSTTHNGGQGPYIQSWPNATSYHSASPLGSFRSLRSVPPARQVPRFPTGPATCATIGLG